MQQIAFSPLDHLPAGVDPLTRLMSWADCTVSALLASEAKPDFFPDQFDLAVRDQQGRAIGAARIDREPGTNSFSLVLIPVGASAPTPPEVL